MKKFGIGKRTMTGGTLLIGIPILLIGFICTLTVSNKLMEMSGGQLQALGQKLAELCDNMLEEELKVSKTLGSNEFMALIMDDDSNEDERKKALEDILGEHTQALGDHYEAVSVADKTGQVVAHNHGGDVDGMNVASTDYFQKALKGEASIGEIVTSRATGLPMLPIAAPIVDRTGAIHGVLLTFLKDNYLGDRIAHTKFGKTGFAALVSQEGLVLAHPNRKMVLKTNISGAEGTPMAPMWALVKDHIPGVAHFTFNGVDRMGGVAPLSAKPWSVAVNQNRSELLAPAYEIRNIIILVGGIFMVITIALVMIYTRSLSLPLGLMAENARRLALGDIEIGTAAGKHAGKIQARKDEIGEMARAFSSLRTYIQEKADLSVRIAEGDLNCRVQVSSEQDVLGNSFEKMTENLKDIVGQVDEAAMQIDTGTTQVSDSSQALSQGATEQAASLEEITSSVAQLASQTKTNAENAAQANRLSIIAREKAETGNEQIGEMTSAMAGISNSSKEIAKIIKTIDDIAFQTNLLALNAAVEAARAGTHGKGFAVVAQEVRSLAGRSAKAAQETAEMIEGALRTIDSGSAIVERTTGSLVEIVEGATKASDLVSEIASASNEQAEGIAQINQGLSQVETVTQQNTASAEETASASEELTHQAVELRRLVSFFKLDRQSRIDHSQAKTVKTAAPRQLPLKKSDAPWGGDTSGPAEPANPKVIISLDDDDFGKY